MLTRFRKMPAEQAIRSINVTLNRFTTGWRILISSGGEVTMTLTLLGHCAPLSYGARLRSYHECSGNCSRMKTSLSYSFFFLEEMPKTAEIIPFEQKLEWSDDEVWQLRDGLLWHSLRVLADGRAGAEIKGRRWGG